MLKRGVLVAAVVAAIVAMGWAEGLIYHASDFSCSCEEKIAGQPGGVCWLDDYRLRNKAIWTFEGVPQGVDLILRLEGVAEDHCGSCVGREAMIWLFYGTGQGEWERMELVLKSKEAGCSPAQYRVAGEAHFSWYSPVPGAPLVIMAKRVDPCDPHLGFTISDLTLETVPAKITTTPAPKVEEEVIEEKPAPPPPRPKEECTVPPVGACFPPPDYKGENCPVPEIPGNANWVQLPETSGTKTAVLLGEGYYVGEIGYHLDRLSTDYYDWYRLEVKRGQALLFWFKADPGLDVNVVFLNDPCGHELFRYDHPNQLIQCIAPCKGKEPVCRMFVRIDRKSGQGKYHIAILPAVPEYPAK